MVSWEGGDRKNMEVERVEDNGGKERGQRNRSPLVGESVLLYHSAYHVSRALRGIFKQKIEKLSISLPVADLKLIGEVPVVASL
jgi:hypothetical protein